MSDIKATIQSQPITASVSGGGFTAVVGSLTVAATATGGIGPQGPQGNEGAGLVDLTDVTINAPAGGDLLRYDGNKWKNFPERRLVIDGGNW